MKVTEGLAFGKKKGVPRCGAAARRGTRVCGVGRAGTETDDEAITAGQELRDPGIRKLQLQQDQWLLQRHLFQERTRWRLPARWQRLGLGGSLDDVGPRTAQHSGDRILELGCGRAIGGDKRAAAEGEEQEGSAGLLGQRPRQAERVPHAAEQARVRRGEERQAADPLLRYQRRTAKL